MITPTRLEAFLKVIEDQSPAAWDWGKYPDDPAWHVKYQVSYPPLDFDIEFNEEMLYVQSILRDLPVRAECWLALYRMLLRLNEELSLVKFGLTPSGSITLMGELPSMQFSLDTLQNLLGVMVYYLEQLYWEIGVIAQAKALAPFLIGQESALAEQDIKGRKLVRTMRKPSEMRIQILSKTATPAKRQ